MRQQTAGNTCHHARLAIYAVTCQLLLLLHGILVELEELLYLKFAGECLMNADILAEELMHSRIRLPGSIK